jgi:hypothetical membrane protein
MRLPLRQIIPSPSSSARLSQAPTTNHDVSPLTSYPLLSIVIADIYMTNLYNLVICLIAERNNTMTTSVQKSSKGMGELPIALRLLLSCGAIGPLLFIIVFLIEGATRADYNPFRYPVSSLSIGKLGWIQAANFLMIGLLLFAFALRLRRTLRGSKGGVWGPLLIGLASIGLFGAGIFTTDPIYGYPPDAPLILAQYSVHGNLHNLFSALLFVGLPAACFVLCRRFVTLSERGWALYSILSGLAMLVTFVLAGIGFSQNPSLVNFAGVFQRLSIAIGLIWIALLAFQLMSKKLPISR